MNLLTVGVSHHTAPVDLLERLSVSTDEAADVLAALVARPYVQEAVVLSTCNRVEVYTAVAAFHGGLAEIGAVLAERAGVAVAQLAPHLYVRYETDAVRHGFRVAAGLDSMVIGEAQILGQLREAYAVAAEHDTVGRLLHELMQQALRVGKRVHTETGIDRAGQSIVTAALTLAGEEAAKLDQPGAGTGERGALVIGAGAMGSLALATLGRRGVEPRYVANRAVERADRLAQLHHATAAPLTEVTKLLDQVDLVICATASPEPIITEEMARAAIERRAAEQPLVLLDLAVPRDVDPAAGQVPGVLLIDMTRLGNAQTEAPAAIDRVAAESIVTAEVDAFLSWLRGNDVAPTVAALRARADEVVEAELRRLAQRRPDLTDEQRADVVHAVHRVVQRLLHSPTVRVRELAATPGGDHYAAALRELFDLSVSPETVSDRGGLTRAVEIGDAPTGTTGFGEAV